MITAWRWDREDQLPDERKLGVEWLDRLRAAHDQGGLPLGVARVATGTTDHQLSGSPYTP